MDQETRKEILAEVKDLLDKKAGIGRVTELYNLYASKIAELEQKDSDLAAAIWKKAAELKTLEDRFSEVEEQTKEALNNQARDYTSKKHELEQMAKEIKSAQKNLAEQERAVFLKVANAEKALSLAQTEKEELEDARVQFNLEKEQLSFEEDACRQLRDELDEKEKELKNREMNFIKTRAQHEEDVKGCIWKQKQLNERESKIQAQENSLGKRAADLDNLEQEIFTLKRELEEKQVELSAGFRKLEGLTNDLKANETAYQRKELRLRNLIQRYKLEEEMKKE